jgi:hypothetical protein
MVGVVGSSPIAPTNTMQAPVPQGTGAFAFQAPGSYRANGRPDSGAASSASRPDGSRAAVMKSTCPCSPPKASALRLGTGMATTRPSYHHVAHLHVPIACAGVAVYPGDVIHGDADNIIVIPAYLALRVQRGEALWGPYPPGPQTGEEHGKSVAAGRPPLR